MTDKLQHHAHSEGERALDKASQRSLAHSATLHCLLGCGIGEVIGVIIGTALEFFKPKNIGPGGRPWFRFRLHFRHVAIVASRL